jgi:hypothetical protein
MDPAFFGIASESFFSLRLMIAGDGEERWHDLGDRHHPRLQWPKESMQPCAPRAAPDGP